MVSSGWGQVQLISYPAAGSSRKSRGVNNPIFNISHNVGGGLVAPIAGASIAWLELQEHWQAAEAAHET